ncbi:hypothetical protein SAMN05443634_103230 [Chishuiella changwenlii]|uniref:Uncharacterized protein n=1 Tax=Chishuiella changwenlii TaxID=1434701 RepID=A0A1M6V973_9FLAO|nr:hypothetical protein [Chishuiella changwenlii]GGF01497.1 hypothetical protein GCM10010984_18690 [Chishuiella changwenlii]SHK77866.1 hypothetical protein SAMN05443634_103230 [Chishuiella changwenlii]
MLFFDLILKTLFVINGPGAASGLVIDQQYIYTIADNDATLYVYDKKKKKVENVDLKPEIKSQEITKGNKPDFEAITKYEDHIYVIGSGSKENRFDLISYNLNTKEIKNDNYKFLFSQFLEVSQLSEKDFNIEGIVADDNATYFFNRGNGPAKRNGIFRVDGKINDLRNKKVEFFPIELPEITNELTTFSDAILVNGKILFTATVELNSTTYHDGEIKGSIIGELDLETMNVVRWEKIVDNRKIEGLALKKKNKRKYIVYMCEDNDDDSKKATIYQYKYKIKK